MMEAQNLEQEQSFTPNNDIIDRTCIPEEEMVGYSPPNKSRNMLVSEMLIMQNTVNLWY